MCRCVFCAATLLLQPETWVTLSCLASLESFKCTLYYIKFNKSSNNSSFSTNNDCFPPCDCQVIPLAREHNAVPQ